MKNRQFGHNGKALKIGTHFKHLLLGDGTRHQRLTDIEFLKRLDELAQLAQFNPYNLIHFVR